MKIALVQCPGWGRDCPPYTMALLSAVYRKAAHEVFCFDLNNALYVSGSNDTRKIWDDKDLYAFWENQSLVEGLIEDNKAMVDFVIDSILNSDARMVGFTVHFSSVLASLSIARRIKERDRSRFIVFGGPDCARQFKGLGLIRDNAVDCVVLGEGDETALELAYTLEKKGRVDHCPGTLLKGPDNEPLDCGDRGVVENLDLLPFPDYSDFRDEISSRLYREPNRLDILDSRGCITQCHFCSEWQFWKKFRSMSGERIYAEIAHQMDTFPWVNYFYFIGSLLNGNVQALDRFCDLVLENRRRISWAGQAVVSSGMDRALLRKMKDAGCRWLGIGIESGSPSVVKRMNKKYSHDNAEQMLRDAHDAGISTQINIMFGIPGETEDDFRMTLDFLKKVRPHVDSVLASQSFCVIDKGTYLYLHPEEFSLKDTEHHLYWEACGGNTYLERQRRYEEFCGVALSLGLPETSGVLRLKPDKWLLLGDYHMFKKDFSRAMECYEESLRTESDNASLRDKIASCKREINRLNSGRMSLQETMDSLVDNNPGFPETGEDYGSRSGLGAVKRPQDGLNQRTGGSLEPAIKTSLEVDIKFNLEMDIDRLIAECEFGEKQKNIINALYSRKLFRKLSNYIICEKEKFERREVLSALPFWLVVDPCNYCNLACPFCPTGQGRGARAKGVFKLDDFERILSSLGPTLLHVDFVNWGEPTLNKDLFKMIKIAKKYDIDTKVDSNFTCLDEKDMEEMVLSGLDKVIVSMDGLTPETYSKYRVNGDFNKAMGNMVALVNKKKELGRKNPYVSWQFLVFRHNEHEVQKARALAKDIGVDHIGITKAFIGDPEWFPQSPEHSHYADEKAKDGDAHTSGLFRPTDADMCNWPWEAVVLNPNGSVSVCCSVEDEKDDFGNIFSDPLSEIWNGPMYRLSRRYIKDKFAENPGNICCGCRHAGLTNLDIMSCHSFFG